MPSSHVGITKSPTIAVSAAAAAIEFGVRCVVIVIAHKAIVRSTQTKRRNLDAEIILGSDATPIAFAWCPIEGLRRFAASAIPGWSTSGPRSADVWLALLHVRVPCRQAARRQEMPCGAQRPLLHDRSGLGAQSLRGASGEITSAATPGSCRQFAAVESALRERAEQNAKRRPHN